MNFLNVIKSMSKVDSPINYIHLLVISTTMKNHQDLRPVSHSYIMCVNKATKITT